MFLTQSRVSRRALLRSATASLALPFLDAMAPAQTPARRLRSPTRFSAIEMVHGAAGSAPLGRASNLWSPRNHGANFELTPTLCPLESVREYLTIVSNTELHNAMSLVPEEDGPMADHARSSAVFLTAAHPRRTENPDVQAGPSIDQIYAGQVGRTTSLRSLEMCIEDSPLMGGC